MISESDIQHLNKDYSKGIEILVDMVKTSKIDPWNIDIVEVTDQFLQELVERKSHNLRLTAKTLFLAAVLLRMKSDILEGISLEEPEEEMLEPMDMDYDNPEFDINSINTKNLVSLDKVLERRTSVRLNKNRTVTLKDLIKQLEFYEEMEKRRSLQNAHERAKRRAKSYANFTPDDIIEMAHDESLS